MTTAAASRYFTDADRLADAIIDRVGKRIVLGLPLGLGKAPHVVNALFRRAMEDRQISLHIFSALTLEKPHPRSLLEKRFLEPVSERLMGDYPELAYVDAQRRDCLPDNIAVDEFFFQAGTRLHTPSAQRSYISANYTHALRYLVDRGVNVVAQLVARRERGRETRFSLSCNTDISCDLLRARSQGNASFILVGQVNSELPFMAHDAELGEENFTFILEGKANDFALFGPPKEPITLSHHAIGLHTAALVKDGGTLQLGIGSMGDAVASALILRHQQNDVFRQIMDRLNHRHAEQKPLETEPFDQGLHGITEMFVDSFLDLAMAGVLKREVDGALLHAGFFIGPRSFYAALRDLDEEQRDKLRMCAISFVNDLYGDEAAKRAARRHARFINSAMMVTLSGAAVSDGLEDGRVVSGVGGQYNFVAQAFALDDARSVITLDAVRGEGAKAQSNIKWSYGHETIPRHLRDIVVTQYGVADLRGVTDEQIIQRLLAITDSRFQAELLDKAKAANKIRKDYRIPEQFCRNTPDQLAETLEPARRQGLLPMFPLGTEFTPTEQRLLPALARLQKAQATSFFALANIFRHGWKPLNGEDQACIDRMGMDKGGSLTERVQARLLRGALSLEADTI